MFLDVRVIRVDPRIITGLNDPKERRKVNEIKEVAQSGFLGILAESRLPLLVFDASKIKSEWVVRHERVMEMNLPKNLKQYNHH